MLPLKHIYLTQPFLALVHNSGIVCRRLGHLAVQMGAAAVPSCGAGLREAADQLLFASSSNSPSMGSHCGDGAGRGPLLLGSYPCNSILPFCPATAILLCCWPPQVKHRSVLALDIDVT